MEPYYNIVAGEANVGLVRQHELGERQLKAGDLYRIPAGSTFYMQNIGEGQRLQLILSIDTSDSLRMGTLEVHGSFLNHHAYS